MSLHQAIHSFSGQHWHVLPAGTYVSKPSELLMSHSFNELLADCSKAYDAVMIDTAPILAVTDGVMVAKHAGINFLLIGSGMHQAEEIEFAVKRLYSNDIKRSGHYL